MGKDNTKKFIPTVLIASFALFVVVLKFLIGSYSDSSDSSGDTTNSLNNDSTVSIPEVSSAVNSNIFKSRDDYKISQNLDTQVLKKEDTELPNLNLSNNTSVKVSQKSTEPLLTKKYNSENTESYISGDFNGWNGRTLYKLDNGEYWQQSEYSYSYDYDYHPKVLIYQSGDGYKMHVYDYSGEDVGVQQIYGVIESRIDGDFEGWEGETIYPLTNGQIWQQSTYHYHYHYSYSPKVLIYQSGGGYKMHVEGDNDTEINVTRLN